MPGPSLEDRIAGALLGLAAGDALGSTLEFMPAESVRSRFGTHTELVGGGPFGWRSGQGTDDTDLAAAIVRAYLGGYSLARVGEEFLAWYASGPTDVGIATGAALRHLRDHGDPRASGPAVWNDQAAGNGSLLRCLPTGLVRTDPASRRREAAEISAVTHSDPRCVDACIACCDLVARLLSGESAAAAVRAVAADESLKVGVRGALLDAAEATADEIESPSTFVLDTLRAAVWALLLDATFEDALVAAVNLGGDADSVGAVAGGLLGARDGARAIPARWLKKLEYRDRLAAAAPVLAALRGNDA